MNVFKGAEKALVGFVVAFVGALVAQVQAGSALSAKVYWLALGTAAVTSFGVYATKNSQA